MCLKNLLSMCFVLAASFCVASAQQCGRSRLFTHNSTYDTNRHIILSTLAANVSSRDGLYNGTVGEGSGKIYALGMCIPGVERKLCSDCIEAASIDLIQDCPNQVDSFNWKVNGTLCFVRYSNRSFYEHLNQEPTQTLCNSENINWNEADFNKTWVEFMELMIGAASFSTPTSYGLSRYAAKASPMLGFQRIYALMQCIPGLSSTDCEACLRRSVSGSQGICKNRQGSNILRPVCFFKWETFPYYGAFSDLNSPTLLNPQAPPQPQPMPPSESVDTIPRGALIAVVVVGTIVVALLALGFVFWRRRKLCKTSKLKNDDDITSPQSLQFDFKTLDAATDKFSNDNKIGRGGFGEVYKGTFPNGTEVAVKRLSRTSEQGLKEFKNEVDVLARLQHRNLVSILGFCLEGEEKILVYEFVPNKSLDYFLFDPVKQVQLDWTKRYNIIGGIVRGILYLHHDSRIKIIHRDLKASNILLDDDMNPKIADFGMARIFGMEQTRADTSRIAGTYGYMAPEYAMHGQISAKSDVYSFGVLVLEIITGKMNSFFYQTDGFTGNLITYAWSLWRKGSPLELLDPTFGENYQSDEVTRCIHVALLCVQEDPKDRPTLSTIMLMLTSSSITLPVPQETRIVLAE